MPFPDLPEVITCLLLGFVWHLLLAFTVTTHPGKVQFPPSMCSRFLTKSCTIHQGLHNHSPARCSVVILGCTVWALRLLGKV